MKKNNPDLKVPVDRIKGYKVGPEVENFWKENGTKALEPIMITDLDKAALADYNLDRWHSEFQKSQVAKSKAKCVAPIKVVSQTASKLMQSLIPDDIKIGESNSSVVAVVEKCWYFGYMEKLALHQFEPDFFGSVKVVTAGAMQIHMMSPASLKELLNLDEDKIADGKDLMNGLEEAAVLAATGSAVKIYSGTADASLAPVAVVIPAGFYVSLRPVNGAVSGFRRSFLTRDAGTLQNLELLAKSPSASKLVTDGVVELLQKATSSSPSPSA